VDCHVCRTEILSDYRIRNSIVLFANDFCSEIQPLNYVYIMSEPRPLRILALDGGGVRGLSEVLMLKNLFQRVDFEENDGRRSEFLPEPWKFFDLICGTSTGGLLALMLGRLRMVRSFFGIFV